VGAGGQFLRKVGVALGAGEHVIDDRVGRGVAEERAEVRHELAAVERGQLDTLDGCQPGQLGQDWTQRVPPVQVFAAITGDEDKVFAAHTREQEGEQVAGGLVGPVQVLDHHDQRAELLAHGADEAQDRVEQRQSQADVAGAGERR